MVAFCLTAGAGITLLLAGCGGEADPLQTTAPAITAGEPGDEAKAPGAVNPADEPDPATDKTVIESTLASVLEASDPATTCAEALTPRYLRRTYGSRASCVAALGKSDPAKAARVSEIVVLPDSVAQAQARPRGGSHGGDVLRAELVLQGGKWKLDSLRSNVQVGP
ncbi:hypothetical protein BH24ACT23_BH24ACT23_04290 [soil metagenome]